MRVALFTDNYMESCKVLDPFRQELLTDLARRDIELLFVQTSDYATWEGGYFSDQEKRKLLAKVKSFSPEIVVSLNGSGMGAEVRDVIGGAPVSYWFIDNPGRFPGSLRLFQNADSVFCATKFMMDQMATLHPNFPKARVHYLPFCTNPKMFIDGSSRPLKKFDTSFVGTVWDPQRFVDLVTRKVRTRFDRNRFLEMLAEAINGDDSSFASNFKRYFRLSEATRDLHNAYDDFVSTQKRLTVLDALSDFDVGIFGTVENWQRLTLVSHPLLFAKIQIESVDTTERLAEVYQSSRSCLSIAHNQAKSGFPIRIFDIMASGTPLITDRHSELDELFTEGEHFLGFDSPSEARARLINVLEDQGLAKKLSEQGRAAVLQKHTFERRVDSLLGQAVAYDAQGPRKSRIQFLSKLFHQESVVRE